jgi:hypothetical protein
MNTYGDTNLECPLVMCIGVDEALQYEMLMRWPRALWYRGEQRLVVVHSFCEMRCESKGFGTMSTRFAMALLVRLLSFTFSV